MTASSPRWGFFRILNRFPRAITLWSFGPESQFFPWAIILRAFDPESQNSKIAING